MKLRIKLSNLLSFIKNTTTTKSLVLSIFSSIICSSLLSIILWFFMKNKSESYTDIIVGHITWINFYKSSDYVLIYTFLSLFLFFLFPFLFMFNKIFGSKTNKISVIDDEPPFGWIFNVIVVGFIYSVSIWLFTGDYTKFGFITTLSLAMLLLAFLYKFVVNKSKDTSIGPLTTVLSLALVNTIFLYLSGNAILVFIKQCFPLSFINHPKKALWIVSFTIVVGILFFVYAVLKKVDMNKIFKFTYFIQIPIPLLLLIVINDVYQQGNKIIEMNIPIYTKFFIWGLTLFFIWYCIIKFKKNRCTEFRVDKLVLWPTALATSCFLSYRTPAFSSLLRDDFHFGEIILPWQQIIQFNQHSYSEFVSVQGLLGLLYGGVNNLFFEGTSSSFPMAAMFIVVLFGVITTGIVCNVFGSAWGMLFSLLAYPVLDRSTLIFPVFLILLNRKLIRNPLSWFLTWSWLSLIHCFYSPNFGPALTLATLPFAIYMLVRLFSTKKIVQLWRSSKITIFSLVIFHVLAVTLLLPYMLQLIKFLLDNSSTNTLAYGISMFEGKIVPKWFPNWFDSELFNWIFWQMIRSGPTILCFVLLTYVILKFHSSNNSEEIDFSQRFQIYYLSLGGILLILFLIPYSFGRIDTGSISRPGVLSLLSFGTLLFFMLIVSRRLFNKWMFIAIIAVIIGYRSAFSFYQFEKLPSRAIETIKVPNSTIFVDGSDIGLPNLGTIFIDKEKLNEIVSFKDTINSLLKDDETYFDLTNRSALYYYVNKPVPSLYSADYVSANYSMQSKVIGQVEKNNPPIAFIGPATRLDGGPASIRSYRLYKWLLDNEYVYYEKNNFQFMIRPDRYDELSLGDSERDYSNNLAKVFHITELRKIPIAWGNSFKYMQERFNLVESSMKQVSLHDLSVTSEQWNEATGKDPYIEWNFNKGINGAVHEFALIDIEISGSTTGSIRGQVFFAEEGNFSEERSFKFDLHNGAVLLPLGSSPYWLNQNITKFRLDLDGLGRAKFKVKSVQFYNLVH